MWKSSILENVNMNFYIRRNLRGDTLFIHIPWCLPNAVGIIEGSVYNAWVTNLNVKKGAKEYD